MNLLQQQRVKQNIERKISNQEIKDQNLLIQKHNKENPDDQLEYVPKNKNPNAEKNNGKSATVPDQAMSIDQILTRFGVGREIPTYEPVYQITTAKDRKNIFPELDKMDMMEKMEFHQDLKQQITEDEKLLIKLQKEAELNKDKDPDITFADLPAKILKAVEKINIERDKNASPTEKLVDPK